MYVLWLQRNQREIIWSTLSVKWHCCPLFLYSKFIVLSHIYYKWIFRYLICMCFAMSCFQLLSSQAVQKGEDKEGIWGFLYKDIKSELDRGSREVYNLYVKSIYPKLFTLLFLGLLLLQKTWCYYFMLWV